MTKSTIEVLKEDLFLLGEIQNNTPVAIRNEAAVGAKDELKQKLHHGSWIIEFMKVDGTFCTMEATLDPTLLPSMGDHGNEHTPPNVAEAGHILRVYSLDRQGWRSFIVGNLTKIYRPSEAL